MSKEVEHKEKRSKLGMQRGKRKIDKYKTNRCLRKGIRRNYQSPDLMWEKIHIKATDGMNFQLRELKERFSKLPERKKYE